MATITDEAPNLLELAWGLIANAGWDAGTGQDDLAKSPGWHEAATRWRDRYHAWLGERQRGQIAERAEEIHAEWHRGVIVVSLDSCPEHNRMAFEEMARGRLKG